MELPPIVNQMRAKGYGFNLTITPEGRVQTSFYQPRLCEPLHIISGDESDRNEHIEKAAKVAQDEQKKRTPRHGG